MFRDSVPFVVASLLGMDPSPRRRTNENAVARKQAKIKKFQQLTDRFRGGLIKAPAYYQGVEELFGEDNVEVRAYSAGGPRLDPNLVETHSPSFVLFGIR